MNWIKRHSLVAYFVLAYVITWVGVSPLVVSSQDLLDIQVSPNLHAIGAFGPVLAASIISGPLA